MKRGFVLIALALALTGAAACGHAGEAPPPGERAAAEVATAKATVADVAERLEAGGVVAARQTALLTSRIVAPVSSVRVRAGDRVRRGEVLVTLDARDIADQALQARAAAAAAEQALVQARAQQAAARAEEQLAAAWHTRVTALHEKRSATAQERDEADARLAGAAARLAGAQAAIEQAAAGLAAARAGAGAASATESFAFIRAPFDGLVTERLTDPGNLAAPGTPLLRVDSSGERQVEVRVDEARASFIHPGDRADVLIGAADEGSARSALIEGRVTEVARAVAADQRAFTVKVALPGREEIRSGTFARVRFHGPPRRALLVPEQAIRRQGQVRSVFVVEDGTARLRLVQTGDAVPEGVVVLAGLEAGELVVTSPPPHLADGQPVARPAPVQQMGDRQ